MPDVRQPDPGPAPRGEAVDRAESGQVAAPVLSEPDWLKALRLVAFWDRFCEGKWRPDQTPEH